MKLLKLLFDISLIFITVKANCDNLPAETDRTNKESIKLIRYDINLIPFINEHDYKDYKDTDIYKTFKSYIDEQRVKGNFIFYGETTIFFQFKKRINIIQLHARNLKIDKIATKINFTRNGKNVAQKVKTYIYDEETVTLSLHDIILPNDTYTYRLIMKFVGSITDNTGGFFRIPYINNKGEQKWLIAAADFRGAGARQIFPCWDEPDIRTKFNISIKYHGNYTALSNTPIEKIVHNNGTIWTRFKTTVNISPHQVAIVLSDLDYCFDRNSWCRQHVKPQTKFAQTVAEYAKFHLKDMFSNITIPQIVNHVLIPGFRDEGVESWGLILYRETDIIYDEKLDTVARKFEVARMVARKIVHQYFGNLIGQCWWSYLWLNEGIATFLAMRIVNEFIHPQMMDLLSVQFQHESLRLNDYYDMPLVSHVNTASDINSLFSFIYYIKAPVFIRTLFQTISLYAFKTGLNTYLSTYQLKSTYMNSAIAYFLNALQGDFSDLYLFNINLTTRFVPWTKQKRYPVLQMMRDPFKNDIIISLLEKNQDVSYLKDLWIRVIYTTQSNPDSTETIWLNPNESILHLTHIKNYEWIILNVQQAGYYRVYYDDDNWQKLIKYLNSMEYFNIHVLNRAQIIDDAYYFLSINKLDFNSFKTLTYYLSNETDYVAWYPMFKILEHISGFFPFPESTEVKKHFQKILDFVLRKIEFLDTMEEDGFIKCLRQEAAKWSCNLNSRDCTTAATSNLMRFYKKPRSYPIPGWKEWLYCKGMILANNTTWNKLLNEEILDNKLLEFLACSKNHTIIISYIERLISKNFTKIEHSITIFHSIIAKHAKNDLVLDYILQNFVKVVPKEMKYILAFVNIINHVYSKNQLDKVKFFAHRYFSFNNHEYVLRKIAIRDLEIEKHTDYFKSFLKTK